MSEIASLIGLGSCALPGTLSWSRDARSCSFSSDSSYVVDFHQGDDLLDLLDPVIISQTSRLPHEVECTPSKNFCFACRVQPAGELEMHSG